MQETATLDSIRRPETTSTASTWVHGSAVMPYIPPEFDHEPLTPENYARVYGRRHGWGTEFGPLSETRERWFQFPIPGVPHQNRQVFLDVIVLLFNSQACGITQIDYWDGPTKTPYNVRIDPPVSGNHRALDVVGRSNRWTPRDPQGSLFRVRYALNVSVQVMFDALDGRGSILFSAAGIRFAMK
jgi:hypothetical protein